MQNMSLFRRQKVELKVLSGWSLGLQVGRGVSEFCRPPIQMARGVSVTIFFLPPAMDPMALWTLWPFGPYGPLDPRALWTQWPFGPYDPLDPMALWTLGGGGGATRAGGRMMNTREADEYYGR